MPKKYRLVKIALVVPDDQDGYMDLLSDFRDDHPDKLVEWVVEHVGPPASGDVMEGFVTAYEPDFKMPKE